MIIGVDDVSCLGVHDDKLHHLTHGESRLPPYITCVQGYEVVSVHHCVNQSIKNDCEVHITVVAHVNIEPVKLKNQVKKCNMSRKSISMVVKGENHGKSTTLRFEFDKQKSNEKDNCRNSSYDLTYQKYTGVVINV